MPDIQKYKYISFDVFDTLIFRTVAKPEDIFYIIQQICQGYYGNCMDSYAKKRIEAERKARFIRKEKEISLDDIYAQLPYDGKIKEQIKSIEVQVELDNCIPNVPMIEFAKQCKRNGKNIVITTDMYLPRLFFEKLLSKIGVDADAIIISSEEGETKRTGNLFPILLKKLGIKSHEILHIGDNPNNDILQSQKHGIDSVMRWHNLVNENTSVFSNNVTENHIDSLECLFNRANYNKSAYHLGFGVLGPLLYDYCLWLHEEAKINHIDNLLFVAREGYLLAEFYKIVFPNEKEKVKYISLNKNLLRLPLLKETKSLRIYKDSLIKRDFYTWDQIFDTFLIPKVTDIRESISKELKVDKEQIISRNDLYSNKFDDKLRLLTEICSNTLAEQSDFLLLYLQQNGFFSGKNGLINNSINGNGQYMLETYLNHVKMVYNVHGFQFLDSIICKLSLKGRYSKYFGSLNATKFQEREFYRNCLIFEHFLFEPTGTSLSFLKKGDRISIHKSKQYQEIKNNDFICELQQHTLHFAQIYIECLPLPCKGLGMSRLMDFIHYPKKSLVKPLCNLWDVDTDGSRMFADVSIPLKRKYKYFKDVPNSIVWLEAYLVLKGVSLFWLKIIQLKLALIFYLQNKQFLIHDVCVRLKKLKWVYQ